MCDLADGEGLWTHATEVRWGNPRGAVSKCLVCWCSNDSEFAALGIDMVRFLGRAASASSGQGFCRQQESQRAAAAGWGAVLCMRDVKKSTPARTPFRPSCVQKTPGFDQR